MNASRPAPAILDAYPLTLLQQGMLFHSLYHLGTRVYHDLLVVEVDGPVDIEAARVALQACLARHDILRTGFNLTGFSEPMQLVYDHADAAVDVQEMPADRSTDPGEVLARWWAAQAARPFQFEQPPLLRLTLLRRGEAAFTLALAFHHAILDGWSARLLALELLDHYDVALGGRSPAPEPPPPPYRDYVAHEREALADDAHRRYWTEQLRGATATSVGGAAGARAAGKDSDPRVRTIVFDDHLPALREVAGRWRVRLPNLLLAAHLAALAAVTGEADVTTGMVTHGRLERRGGDGMLGLFLNAVPFRMDIGVPSWRDLAAGVASGERAMVPHRRYPLAALQRDLGGGDLFSSLWDLRHFHMLAQPRTYTHITAGPGQLLEQTNFPLSANFGLDAAGEHLSLRLAHDASRLDGRPVEDLTAVYRLAVAALARGGEGRPLELGAGRRPQAGGGAAQAAVATVAGDAPVTGTLLDTLARTVARVPGRAAVRGHDGELTYAQLDAAADDIASLLRGKGIGAEDLVAVAVERSTWLAATLLGVLKARAAYVPVDLGYPAERVVHMLRDSGARIVLTSAATAADLPDTGAEVVAVDDRGDGPAARAAGDPGPAPDPDQLAYVIYTSGSTGMPKGVEITHGSLHNLLVSMRALTGIRERDTLLATTSLSFDIAALELFLPLYAGATVVVERDAGFDGARMRARVEEVRPTLMQATPSLWRMLVEAGWQGSPALRAISGGEALPGDLADALVERCSVLWNAYGPTETTIWSSWARIEPRADVTLGDPVARTDITLAGHGLDPVPDGETGEIMIGGAGLARGYRGQPGLTAARFLPHPGVPGARVYATGDLGRRDATGALRFLGRADTQVKLRGHRIELAEIERVLQRHPSVTSAAVVLRPNRGAEPRLVAYLSVREVMSTAKLQAWMRTSLPEIMVPPVIVFLDRMPLTPNGKVDRNALPEPEDRAVAESDGYQAPRDDLERQLVALWEEILDVRPVGVTDRFVDLGGHSLLALRLIMRIPEFADVSLPASVLFEGGTIVDLAEVIRGSQRRPTSLVRVRDEGWREPLYLVHPLGGGVLCYSAMAEGLDPDVPVYAMQAPGLQGSEDVSVEKLEDFASHYLDHVASVQGTGPYHLGGWCMGGTVAFEMARQLQAAGEQVAFLGIISASVPFPVPEAYLRDDATLLLESFGGRLAITYDDVVALPEEERLAFVLEESKLAGIARDDFSSVDEASRLIGLFKRNARALLDYRPGVFDGDAVLFRPTVGKVRDGYAMGWSDHVTGELAVEQVPGDHHTMMDEPNVAVLARRFRAHLARTWR